MVGAADGSLLVMDFRAAARPHVLGRHMDAITALSMHPGYRCPCSGALNATLSCRTRHRIAVLDLASGTHSSLFSGKQPLERF